MPTELTPSQLAAERESVLTVSYLREKELPPQDTPVSIEATLTVSNLTQLPPAAPGGSGKPVGDTVLNEEERMEQQQAEAESEQFIALAELVANRMSESGEWYARPSLQSSSTIDIVDYVRL